MSLFDLTFCVGDDWKEGQRLVIKFKMAKDPLKSVAWHYKGDYFTTVCPTGIFFLNFWFCQLFQLRKI